MAILPKNVMNKFYSRDNSRKIRLSVQARAKAGLKGFSLINREKIDAIREAIQELERAGYIVRSRKREEKGRLRGTDYVIFEQPQPPAPDLPALENPTQLKKDIQRTDFPKKKNQIQIYQALIPFLSVPPPPGVHLEK